MKEQRKIVLGGETVSYTLERKAVKNINLRLRPDTGLSVSAPKYVALSQVERVLMQHQQKILETLRQYQTAAAERRQQYPRSFSTGETVQGDKLLLLVKHPEDAQCRERVFNSWWETSCEKAVRNLCRAVYPVFEAKGVAFPEIRFRRMVAQWGNCRPTRGVLTFNLRLLAAPVRCIEYVVIHEFTHFLHPDHSPAFYAEIAAELPDWKQLQETLQHMVETRI